MKKLFLLFTLVLFFCVNASAQTYQDVIFLKNGDIVRGNIVEKKTGEYIKLKLSNGDVKTYEEDDIEKIEKQVKRIDRTKSYNGLSKGYRGFVDVGYSIGASENDQNSLNRIELSTTHGYQTCPYFFIGLGVGLHYYYEHDSNCNYGTNPKTEIPLFLDGRYTFLNKKFTPSIDLRGGYSVGSINGWYYALSVGFRALMKNKSAFNLGVGLSCQIFNDYLKDVNDYYYDDSNTNEFEAVTIKIGFDF